MPHPVVKELTHLFFREMFVELAEQLKELIYACICLYSRKKYGIEVNYRFLLSGLINIAEHLVEEVQPLH